MTRQEAIRTVKVLSRTAGAERLRLLFDKYNLADAPLRVSSVMTGMKLYGAPFFSDLLELALDARQSQSAADGTDTGSATTPPAAATTADKSTWDYILAGGNTVANMFGTIFGALNGSGSQQVQYVPQTNASGQVIYVPTGGGSGSSGGNTALWVILGVVGVAVVGMVIFMVARKK
jgi:hypothetical protein